MNSNSKWVPVAVIIAGLIIAGAIIYSGKATPAKNGGTTGGNAQQTAQTKTGTIKIESYDPVMGQTNAPVTVVEAADFQCPFCGAASGDNQTVVQAMQQQDPSWQPIVTNLIKDYVDTGKVKFVFKQFPFLGADSETAAEASFCAQDQGKFWDFYKYTYAHQGQENSGSLSAANLKQFAQTLGLNTTQFDSCLDSGKYKNQVAQDKQDGINAGVSSTPTWFVGNQQILGAVPFSQIQSAINSQLSAAGK